MHPGSAQPLVPPQHRYRLWPGDGNGDPSSPRITPFDHSTTPREELPYKVELWDERKASVEQVLAVTANSSIGYAAYYAAAREHPDRYITLRHKDRIVSRSNPPRR